MYFQNQMCENINFIEEETCSQQIIECVHTYLNIFCVCQCVIIVFNDD